MALQQTAVQRVARAVSGAIGRRQAEFAGAPLLVAVSGGPDSTALLLALLALNEKRPPSLTVVHFSHGLRPRSEKREAALVEGLAAWSGLPFVHGCAAPGQLRRSSEGSVEAAARAARYAFVAEAARQTGARAVALGHTLDDQAETVLLRLARGTGLHGLGAMRECTAWTDPSTGTALQLFRPLLTVRRQETEAACAEAGVVPARDRSNSSLAFARNRVRHRVLRDLERINPGVRQALARYALSAQEDDGFLRASAASAAEGHRERDGAATIWPRKVLQDLPGPLLVRVFQMAWEAVRGPGAALSSAHLSAMADVLRGPVGRQVVLPHGMTFSVACRSARLGPIPAEERLASNEVPVSVPGACRAGPWWVEVREQNASSVDVSPSRMPQTPYSVLLNAEAVGLPLVVRGRRHGDRFQPLGMQSFKRLQDFYVDAKVPRWERDAVPLLVAPEGIAWVVGHRVASWAAATTATRRALAVTARKIDPQNAQTGCST